jgi:outer membrane protein OmpA-like peptidoglycan-associated protein
VFGAALLRNATPSFTRSFSLAQIRDIVEVRRLAPVIGTDPILFDTGSAALSPAQAGALAGLAGVMLELLRDSPREVFLIEGHTDATGSAAFNLALSDRRAETVVRALVDYFGVPPENLVFQGYGEALLAIPTQAAEPRNRRVEIRRITTLLHPIQG